MRNLLALALLGACATSPVVEDSLGNAIHVPTWLRSWDTSGDRDVDCTTKPIEHVQVSPLVRYRTGARNTRAGVVVYLSPLADPPDQLLLALRCHRAWMLQATKMHDDCPLDLPGLAVEARGDDGRITITVTAREPRLVAELQRRVARSVENHTEVADE